MLRTSPKWVLLIHTYSYTHVSSFFSCLTFDVPLSESIAISSEVLCPETWVKFRQSCYNFKPVVLRMSLDEARERCKKEGTAAPAYRKHVASAPPSVCKGNNVPVISVPLQQKQVFIQILG